MNTRTKLAIYAMAASTLLAMSACAVTRGQQSTGAYIDDSAITASVKSRFVESKDVDAAAISVETLNGTVMLSGFAKNANGRLPPRPLRKKWTASSSLRTSLQFVREFPQGVPSSRCKSPLGASGTSPT